MRFKFTILLLFISIYFTSNLYSKTDKLAIAVIDLELSGLDESMTRIFSDRLRSELMKQEIFDVMERNRMDVILSEQGFQQTGVCNSDQCIVQAGRLLGVTHMVAGSLGRIGELHTISLRLINVESGVIQSIVTDDYEGRLEDILTQALARIANKMAAEVERTDRDVFGSGSIEVSSMPTGGEIYIDDRSIPFKTPATIDSIKAGVHVIRVQKGLLQGAKTIFIAPDRHTFINIPLTMAKGTLKIVTEPQGIHVHLDNKYVGESPLEINDLHVGAYFIKLSQEGYLTHTEYIAIKEKEMTLVSAKMLQVATISIGSDPVGSEIFFDDSLYGKTPIHDLKLAPGYHRVKIQKNGYVAYEKVHNLKSGENVPIVATLTACGTILFDSDPENGELYINGIYRGNTPIVISDLTPGFNKFKIKKEFYKDSSRQYLVHPGKRDTLNFSMRRKLGKIFITTIPDKATIELNGGKVGESPVTVDSLAFGNIVLSASKPGYETVKDTIILNDSIMQIKSIRFKLAKGTVYFLPNPKDANLFLDGQVVNVGNTNGIDLLPGEYQVNAERAGYENFKKTILVLANEGRKFDVNLIKKRSSKAVLKSLLFPGFGQYYAEKKTRAILFTSLELASLAGIAISNAVYEHHIDEYEANREKYIKAVDPLSIREYKGKMNQSYDSIGSARDYRRVFTYSAIGVWVLNVIESAIFDPICPAFIIEEQGVKMNVMLNF